MSGHDLATWRAMRADHSTPLEPVTYRHSRADPDSWRANIGEPVAFDAGSVAAPDLAIIDVLCWNVAIGLGRLDALIGRLAAGEFERSGGPHGRVALSAERPLVILLQEAFRSDASVPAVSRSTHHGGKSPTAARLDIADLARRLGLSLRYSPSMRNGPHASDRGNAVLSNVRLADARAFLLPHVRQRRVVVTTALDGHPELRFASAHLDTHGRAAGGSLLSAPGSGRAAQAGALGRSLAADGVDTLLGADLNSVFGMADPAVRALVRTGMHPARRIGRWRHTFHTPVRMLVDHVLYHSPKGRIAGVEVVRLDEARRDRSRRVFGSDHHPLLAHVRLSGAD